MPDSGKDLGLDLFNLYKAGTQNLPEVAAEYTAAGTHAANALNAAAGAFQRHQIFGGSSGPAYAEWNELGQTIAKFLHDSGENLKETGEALVLAANNYAATDQAAKAELDNLKRQYGVA
jgi:hypothetical protein